MNGFYAPFYKLKPIRLHHLPSYFPINIFFLCRLIKYSYLYSMTKRFQESNKIIQLWRYRWYILIPILWIWYSTVMHIKVFYDEVVDGELIHTDKYNIMRGKTLWEILKGKMQFKMNWYHTHEEVWDKMKSKLKRK